MSDYKLLSIKEIMEMFGISKSTFYRLVRNDPTFPKPVSLGDRRQAFKSSDIDAWVDNGGFKDA